LRIDAEGAGTLRGNDEPRYGRRTQTSKNGEPYGIEAIDRKR